MSEVGHRIASHGEADSLRWTAKRLMAKANAAEDGTLAMFRRRPLRIATDLAKAKGISATAANNQLKRLWEYGWLRRERADPAKGGKMYLYLATREFLRKER